MTNKTILMPFTRASGGGSFVSAALLAYGLKKIGYRVISVFPEEGGATTLFRQYGNEVEIHKLSTVETPTNPSNLIQNHSSLVFQAQKIIRLYNVDIIHCNDDATILPWGIAALMQKRPSVWHVRSARKGKIDFLRCQVTSLSICISNFAAGRLPKNIKRATIYNPVDYSRFLPCTNKRIKRKSIGIEDDSVLLVHVGRDIPYKRPEWSVATLNKLLQCGINAYLLFLGNFSAFRKQELFNGINLDPFSEPDRIRFFPWVENPEFYISAADLLLHPAYEEPFGRILVEAAACGIPVIATRSGGAPEVVLDGITGYLSDPSKVSDFYDKTIKLLKSPEQYKSMSCAALARSKYFSLEAHAQKVSQAYDRYLG